ncbi:MAG: hypothetical protein HY690_07590 [Chloroflexi bacterium]|nr:hypothetical protein [Chloroflexota bacterium]
MSVEQDPQVEHPTGEHQPRPQRSLGRVLVRLAARHPLVVASPLLVIALLLVGVAATSLVLPKAPQEGGVEVLGAQATNSPPAMAKQSMEAMKSLDAGAFWNSLDDQMRQSLAAQGIVGPDGVEQMFAQVRATGNSIKSYQYIARYDMASGETVSFFVAKRHAPDGQEAEVPFLITTNLRGQVVKLE